MSGKTIRITKLAWNWRSLRDGVDTAPLYTGNTLIRVCEVKKYSGATITHEETRVPNGLVEEELARLRIKHEIIQPTQF